MELINTINPLKRFWMLLKPDQKDIKSIYAYAIFIGLVNLSLPVGIQAIINLIQGGTVSTSWIVLVILVVLAIALGGIMQIAQLRIIENIQQKIFVRAAFEFVYRIPRLKLEKLANKYVPELMNRFFDIVSVQKGLSKILIDFSTASIQVLFGLILLSLYHPFFILFSLLLTILIFVLLRTTARKGLETNFEESNHKYRTAHWLEEIARTNKTFKLAGKTELPLENINSSLEKYIDSRDSHFSILIKQISLMVVFKVLVALGLLLIGGILVIEEQMNIGQFVAAELIILLVIGSVEKLIISFETIYDVLTSLEKLGQITDMELDKQGGIIISKDFSGAEIEVNNVTFSHSSKSSPTLFDLSLHIKSGERVLITGENDSGKSTLLYLMVGLYQPNFGSITIDSIPFQNYDREDLYSVVGCNLYDESLFEGTLLENITIGRENATFENVKWAVLKLGLLPLIKALPEGYNTKISPHSNQFSKSNIAKILLARAIVIKPKILVFENSFSIFSHEDSHAIKHFLLDKEYPWTVLISSSQNFELPELLDRQIVLKTGKIIHQ